MPLTISGLIMFESLLWLTDFVIYLIFLYYFPLLQTDSFFPVLRILLPALDRARGAYGVKERKLAELYIRILGLKKEGNDAQKLLHFR